MRLYVCNEGDMLMSASVLTWAQIVMRYQHHDKELII